MTSVSVIIPTCDRPELLKETLQCVIGQTRPADEIIVVNNGKRPLPTSVLLNGARVLELEPYVGVSRARNEGVTVANGEYIAFQDDDDLWELDYLKKVEELINKKKPDCIITRKDKLVGSKVIPYKNIEGKLKLSILFKSNPGIGGPTTVVKRDLFIKTGGYDVSLKTSEDKALIIDLLLNGHNVIAAPYIQAIAREHNSSRLTDSANMEKGITAFIKKYKAHMSLAQKNHNWLKVYRHRYRQQRDTITFFKFKTRQFVDLVFRVLDFMPLNLEKNNNM